MRVAHISDVHAVATSAFENRFRNILKSIRDNQADHLIITGDLTDKATPDEYDTVIRLLNEHGFSKGHDLTVIPGNHDLYPSVYQSFTFRLSTLREEFRREPVRITKELYRVMRAYRRFTPAQYRNALRYFMNRFSESFDNAVAIGSEDTAGFPYIKHLNDEYAVICLESNFVSPKIKMPLPFAIPKYAYTKDMYSVTDNPICSNGWVDTGALKRAIYYPELEIKKLIVLLHHHLYTPGQEERYMKPSFGKTMSLVNRQEFIDVIKESNAEVILHGHWHVTEEYPVSNGSLHALNGAGVFKRDDNRWNLLTLTASSITCEMIQI